MMYARLIVLLRRLVVGHEYAVCGMQQCCGDGFLTPNLPPFACSLFDGGSNN